MTAPPPAGIAPPSGGPPPLPAGGSLPLIGCPNCGGDVPVGEYCGICGVHLAEHPAVLDPAGHDAGDYAGIRAPHRQHSFAAMPNEHVLSLRLLSTLFPHLPHRRTAPFRVALVGLVVVLGGLALTQLTGPAVIVAAAGVPLLYLVYLYEVEVYEDSPLLVVALTFGLGIGLGTGWALLTGDAVSKALRDVPLLGISARDVLYAGVLLPVVAQLLQVLGTVALRFTNVFDEALDGFAFGGAGALGFVFAQTLVNLEPELRLGVRAGRRPVSDILVEVAQRGVLMPVVAAAATGLVGAALWLGRGEQRDPRRMVTGIVMTVLVVLAVDIGLGVLAVTSSRGAVTLPVTAGVAALLVLWARVSLHHMLLAEAVHAEMGPPEPCTHCHRLVPRMSFCPACGISRRATPKTGAGRHGRPNRTRAGAS